MKNILIIVFCASFLYSNVNSNFGFNLSIWDRLLGTYIQDAKREQTKIIIGVDRFRESDEVSLKNLLLMPFREIPRGYSLFPKKD